MRDYLFGNLVARLRTELGYSQFQLGRLTGVSDKAVSKWENGSAKPRIATCCRLADILGVSLDELLSAAGYAQRARTASPDEDAEMTGMQEEMNMAARQDSAPEKRIELHARTGMSSADGAASAAQYIGRAAGWGHAAMAVTDFCAVQALPEAFREAERQHIRLLPGCEGFMLPAADSPVEDGYPVMLLAKDRTGMTHLNQLVTLSHANCRQGLPCMQREWIAARREGLLIGSACDGGEVARSMDAGLSCDALMRIAAFYDYLELEPVENVADDPAEQLRLRRQASAVIRLGRDAGIPVAAVSNARYPDPEDALCRAVIRYNAGILDTEPQPPYHLRTTAEMLEAFRFLGPEVAREIVIDAPGRIAAQVDSRLTLLPDDGKCYPVLPEAQAALTEAALHQAHALYGDPLPPQVEQRLQDELALIDRQASWTVFETARLVAEQSRRDRYPVGTRGAVGSSLVAWLTGISAINPLAPHYRCSVCRRADFAVDTLRYRVGADLPARACPVCGQAMVRDGFSIPYETFFGLEGEKEPDIGLNVTDEEQGRIHAVIREMFGPGQVFCAGTVSMLPHRHAEKYTRRYFLDHHLDPDTGEAARVADMLSCAVKAADGRQPDGLVIVPEGRDVNEFTPVRYPAGEDADALAATHDDFLQLHGSLLKMDLLSHHTPALLHLLSESAGVRLSDIPLHDDRVISLFTSPAALGVTAQQILSETGCYGIPECSSAAVRRMLTELHPATVEELIRISGLFHGADLWAGNVREVIASGEASCMDVPALRDDLMSDLIRAGMARETAFRITESVRRGRGLSQEDAVTMRRHGIPPWYIEACRRIRYLFPRAHAAAYVTAGLQIAWFKVYCPESFYRAWFALHQDDMEETDLTMDVTRLRRALLAVRSDAQTAWSDEETWRAFAEREQRQAVLELLLEMRVRGIAL